MSFRKDNDAYEAWLATQCDVVKKDIDYQAPADEEERLHLPARDLFPLGQTIGTLCPDLMDAPQGALGRRHASGKFRDLARCGRPAGLGRQRFRRSRRHAVSARSGPARGEHPAGAEARGQQSGGRRSPAQGLPRRPRPAAAGAAWTKGKTWLRPYAAATEKDRRSSGRKSPNIRKPSRRAKVASR